MKLKKILLVCSLFLAGGGLATSNEEISRVNAEDGTENTYVKVTEALTDYSGEYLIVYEAGNKIFDGSLTTLDASNNYQSVTITNNQITTKSTYSFTIASETSGYSIKSNSGYYIGRSENSNGLDSSESLEDKYLNTISINNGKTTITGSNKCDLKYNNSSNQDRFRYYKQGQKAISLYKLEDNSVRYTTNFYLNDGTDTYSTKSTKENESVSFPANPTRDGFEFLGWYDSQEGGNKVESLIATDNINLYAQWQEIVIDVQTSFQKEKTSTKLSANYSYNIGTIDTDEKYELSITSNNKYYKNNESKSFNGKSWTLHGSGNALIQNFYSGKGQQFGTGSNPSTSLTLTSDEIFTGVKSIIVNTSGASSVKATLEVTVGGVKMLSDGNESISLTSSATNYTFTSDTPLTGNVKLEYSVTAKAVYIKNVTVNYTSQVESITYKVTDAKIGFASLIKEKSYDENAKYGILVASTDALSDNGAEIRTGIVDDGCNVDDLISNLNTLTYGAVQVKKYECTPVKCDATGKEDENGSYYQYGVIFTNSFENIDTSLTAVAYMELDGKVYLTSNETSYSLRTLAEAYLDSNVLADNEDANGVLNYIVNYGN